jgi:hypothetical protein
MNIKLLSNFVNELRKPHVIARSVGDSFGYHCEPYGGEAISYEKVGIATSLRSSQ